MKFYWDTVIFIHLGIVRGCFCTAMAELGSCDKDPQDHFPRRWKYYSLTLYRKILLAPDLMESLPVKLSEKIITGFGKVIKMPGDLLLGIFIVSFPLILWFSISNLKLPKKQFNETMVPRTFTWKNLRDLQGEI